MKSFTRRILLLLIAAFTALTSQAQLTAGFTASPDSGCAPLVVNFINTTTPATGTTYNWDLDNGSGIIHLTNPAGSYLTAGTYTVTLTAINGSETSTHTQVITVFPLPTVSFSASDTAVCPGTAIIFTSTTIGGVPGTITYQWGFGDGYTSTLANPTHIYSSPGYYNVTLTATNSKGCQSMLTIGAYIHIFTPPSPSFSSSQTYFCNIPGVADFTSFVSGTAPFTYDWNFGDGSSHSYVANPSHPYTSTGSFTVTLIVTDANGCKDTLVRPAYIFVGHIAASFTSVSTACVNTYVTFTNTSTTHTSSSWTFGDGGFSGADNPVYMYHTPGTYTVTLIVSDGPCNDTITHVIHVLAGPTTSFTQTPDTPCPPPVTITFHGSAPSGSTVTWLYGDGGTGSGMTSSHSYGRRGIYTISMITTDPSTGCTDTITRIDTLYDLWFNIIDSNYEGCAPLTVLFKTLAITYEPDTLVPQPYPFPFSSYTWNFGDGSAPGYGTPIYHTYTAAGVYKAYVTAVTVNGCIVSDTATILVGKPPTVTFSGGPLHLCYRNNSVTFTTTVVVGPCNQYDWNFGDGTTENDTIGTVTHHFVLPGIFTVTLTPFYNGCPGPPFVFADSFIIDSPKSIPQFRIGCSPQTMVSFGDSSIGDDSHVWVFGDGTTSTISNPIHNYPGIATYYGYLATYNIRSGCRDTANFTVALVAITPSFVASDTAICRDDTVYFTPTVTGGTATAYYWYVNGSYESGMALFTWIFHSTGRFSIMLIIKDQNNCLDTMTKNNYILVAKPVANFTATPSTGCWPLNASFVDHSTDVAGTTFTNFAWTFGDGGSASVSTTTVSHTFTMAGSFTTQEIVTDNIGCKDTVSLPLVTVYRPNASFNVSNQFPCKNMSITFTNTSTGATGSLWMFGDGGTSTVTSPVHSYSAAGVYTVSLVVTDTHGCHDTAVYPAYINVDQPVASFYMNDSFSICPPLLVHFYNTSTGGTTYQWNLGDGSTSAAISPSDLYTASGIDTIQLVVTNMYGCVDTAIGHVVIYGYAGAFSYTPDSGCAPLYVHFNANINNVPSIIWDYADGTVSTVALTDTITHAYTIPGAYVPKLILSDNTGCQNSSLGLDTIKVDAVIPGFVTVPDPVCMNATMHYKDTSSGFWAPVDAWYWTFTNGDTSTLSNPSYTYTAVGTYSVTLIATDAWGCKGTATENVVVYAPPVITVSPDTVVCVGDAAILYGYGGVSYTWAPPASLSCTNCNPTHASPTVVTNYTVTGTDIHGCSNTDTVSVFLKTTTFSVAHGDTSMCDGLVVPLFDSGATKYTWLPATGLNSAIIADPLAAPQVTTRYMVIAQLASCIPDTNYVMVVVYPLPTVDAGPDQYMVEGSTAQLKATGTNIAKLAWQNPGSLSCDSCSNPVSNTDVTTTYRINVYSQFGCKASDTVTIHVVCDKSQIFIPNSFTPNNDGKNDIFYPRGKGISVINSFRIYNRWGELLFERSGISINDESNGWDGTFKGATPKPDVYVYIIDAQCETGEPINLKGDVTIIR